MLKVKNLSKHFGGVTAVDNVSFEIKKGKITALIGPNGSGKSTLFNLICGILKEDSGKIFIYTEDISKLRIYQIANHGISRLFQHSRLFNNLTVKENLLLALNNKDTKFWRNLLYLHVYKKQDEDQVRKLLDSVGLRKFENKIAGELSYGQKRLIEIIRTILKPHTILMLDEPVAGVNPKLRKDIANMLLDFKKHGETIFFIEHDIDFTSRIADEIIVMDEGRIIAQGSPKRIRNNKKVLETYLGE
jgi:branched-chain amino acid transport system ATP-binding protein